MWSLKATALHRHCGVQRTDEHGRRQEGAGRAGSKVINLIEGDEARGWERMLGVTPGEFKAVVRVVGDDAAKVKGRSKGAGSPVCRFRSSLRIRSSAGKGSDHRSELGEEISVYYREVALDRRCPRPGSNRHDREVEGF